MPDMTLFGIAIMG